MNFDLIKPAKLRQTKELELLFNVSRPMVNRYMTGKSRPQGTNYQKIDHTLREIVALIDAGKLPLAEDKDDAYRLRAIEKIAAYIKTRSL